MFCSSYAVLNFKSNIFFRGFRYNMIFQLPYLVNKAPTAPGMPFSGRGP